MTFTSHAVLASTALILTVGAQPALAQEFKPVTGEYIVSETETKKLKEFGLIVRGRAAKEIYAALPFQAKPDICTGGVKKSDPKGMFCIKQGTEFTCSIGIVLKTRNVTAGPLSC